ncbi:hypothetical protein PsAD13_00456 [Pseudovibrio sp. Ad13]|uniref:hypothetical protein n=1 Tax=unclassified Pseudovibrio TaxID=2627060 RepID=UPI0007AEB33F|nr:MULTISPECIES: hypothetical protein [unclassified Pseudovibrio]KZK87188.1 hypothetical protein PsAD13_00456 [Pseudovibrio sp. Ad13]KZL16360.1 hypothetical protein PsAD26_00399 [Pseudovibrio sp. Ad26]
MATIAMSMALALCFTSIALLFLAVKNRWAARSRVLKRKAPIKGEFSLHPLNLINEEEEKIEKKRLKRRDDL